MKRLLLLSAVLLLLVGCATAPRHEVTQQHAVTPSFTVDQYELLAAHYAAPDIIDGVLPMGPADKEALCTRAGVAVAQDGHVATTCLHIEFKGPIPKGAVVMQPFGTGQTLLEYGIFGIDYALDGSEISGTGHLVGPFKNNVDCKTVAIDTLHGAYRDDKVPINSTLLLYCVGFPTMPQLFHGAGEPGSTAAFPRPWNPVDNTAFQGTALR